MRLIQRNAAVSLPRDAVQPINDVDGLNVPNSILRLRVRRMVIDQFDDALVDLAALRQRVAVGTAHCKHAASLPLQDERREAAVFARARARARRRGLPERTGEELMQPLVAHARGQQYLAAADLDQGAAQGRALVWPSIPSVPGVAMNLLRLLPPPARLSFPLRRVPDVAMRRVLQRALNHVLQEPLRDGRLDFLAGRTLALEVADLRLRWVLGLHDGRLIAAPRTTPAEAGVRGNAVDFLLLASRQEDPDTLFFQRRLALTGDTELGLTARNLLDQLPWESLPLGLRIGLHRFAGLARRARDAHHRAIPTVRMQPQ